MVFPIAIHVNSNGHIIQVGKMVFDMKITIQDKTQRRNWVFAIVIKVERTGHVMRGANI